MLLKNKLLSSKKQKVATLISYTYASVLASRGQTDHGPPLAALFHVTGKRVWLGSATGRVTWTNRHFGFRPRHAPRPRPTAHARARAPLLSIEDRRARGIRTHHPRYSEVSKKYILRTYLASHSTRPRETRAPCAAVLLRGALHGTALPRQAASQARGETSPRQCIRRAGRACACRARRRAGRR